MKKTKRNTNRFPWDHAWEERSLWDSCEEEDDGYHGYFISARATALNCSLITKMRAIAIISWDFVLIQWVKTCEKLSSYWSVAESTQKQREEGDSVYIQNIVKAVQISPWVIVLIIYCVVEISVSESFRNPSEEKDFKNWIEGLERWLSG